MEWLGSPQYILGLWAPLAGYALWRVVWPRLAGSARARYRAGWWLGVLPFLAWWVPYWPTSPLRRLPYCIPLVWGIYRVPRGALPGWVGQVVYGLPVWAFTYGALAAFFWGVGEQAVAAWRVRRLPQYGSGRVRVLRVPGFVAFTFGLFRPRVYVSEEVWNGPHRQAVLTHEMEHARRRDPLTLFIARGMRRGSAPYLPWRGELLRALELEAERACDECACREVGRAAYARALLAATEQCAAPALELGRAVASFARPAGSHNLLSRARSLGEPQGDRQPALFWPAFALAYLLILVFL